MSYYKGKVSELLEKRLKTAKLPINSILVKQKLNDLMTTIKNHYEKVYQCKVVYAKFKFIQDVFGKMYAYIYNHLDISQG